MYHLNLVPFCTTNLAGELAEKTEICRIEELSPNFEDTTGLTLREMCYLYFVPFLMTILCRSWEINTPVSETSSSSSHHQPTGMHAISLREHSAGVAFSSTEYCVNIRRGDSRNANGFSRALCEKCPDCKWKQRDGFRTEAQWQLAVTSELQRLLGGCGGTAGDPTETTTTGELVGSWILELPPSTKKINTGHLEDLTSSLGVSLETIVVAGLKIDPMLEEVGTVAEAVAAAAATGKPVEDHLTLSSVLSSSSHSSGGHEEEKVVEVGRRWGGNEDGRAWGGIPADGGVDKDSGSGGGGGLSVTLQASAHASSTPGIILTSSTSITNNNDNNSSNATYSSYLAPQSVDRLTTAWTGAVGKRVGHDNAVVLAHSDTSVSVEGLNGMVERYSAALEIARHGAVLWITSTSTLTVSNYHASKLVQQWPKEGGTEGRAHQLETWPLKYKVDVTGINTTNNSNDDGNDKTVVLRGLWGRKETSGKATVTHYDELNWRAPLHELGLFGGKDTVVGVSDHGVDFSSCYFADEHAEPPTFKVRAKNKNKKVRKNVREDHIRNYYDNVWESKDHRKLRQYVVGHNSGHGKGYSLDHGTHVAGSLAGKMIGGGSGKKDGQHFNGIAPEAKLAVFEMFHLPSLDIGAAMFSHAYRVGARIYSMSWTVVSDTNPRYHRYDESCRSADKYLYDHQDFIVLSCAGNIGRKDSSNKASSIQRPAISKSVVAVGSHQNIGGGGKENKDHRINVLSAFSRRGPTLDGRIKPDVCGPGESVRSAASAKKLGTASCSTKFMKGTSMSTPIVAGVTVLVRQYFMEGYYPRGVKHPDNEFIPMGALLKAVLVNSGRPLVDKKASPPAPPVTTLPNNDQGWGAVDISTTLVTPLSPPGMELRVYGQWSKDCADCPKVHEGETRLYDVELDDNDNNLLPLKVTLVWYDYQGHVIAQARTVNNLDLSIVSHGGDGGKIDYYHPNGGEGPDEVNTVEHIAIPSPTGGGRYTVKVKGTSVLSLERNKNKKRGAFTFLVDYQYFALVISGPLKHVEESSHWHDKSKKKDEGTGVAFTPQLLLSPQQ